MQHAASQSNTIDVIPGSASRQSRDRGAPSPWHRHRRTPRCTRRVVEAIFEAGVAAALIGFRPERKDPPAEQYKRRERLGLARSLRETRPEPIVSLGKFAHSRLAIIVQDATPNGYFTTGDGRRKTPFVANGDADPLSEADKTPPTAGLWCQSPIMSVLADWMVGATGIEPVTPSMSTRCSPAELRALEPVFTGAVRITDQVQTGKDAEATFPA
jgi:hypothetical protein